MLLLARVERLNEAVVAHKDKFLRDQFLENLSDPQPRRDIKHWIRDHPAKTFQEIQHEVQRWIEDGTLPKKAAVHFRIVVSASQRSNSQLTWNVVASSQPGVSN